MSPLLKALLTTAALALAGYVLLLAALWWGQERLLFHPDVLPAEHRFNVGPDVHEVTVPVDGARLSALHLRLPQPKGVVFYLHGNAGSLDSWFTGADFFRAAGYDLFMLDYRGYGKSSGRIGSQAQLQADVRAAWAQVAPLYQGRRVVLFGRSLGTGLAAGLAAEVQPDLLALVSPYTRLADVAREQFPWVPTALLRYPLSSAAALPQVQGRTWLAHGGRDTLIPPAHSQALARLARQPQLLLVPEAGHNDIHQFPAYLEGLRAELDRL